jgi:lipid II:glycine glycyltransferase (peptidoglycan interpeptide bridge formation enzyme)
MQIEKNINSTIWDKFVEESNQNNIFCKSIYLNNLNVSYENYVLMDKDKKILIGIILFDEKYSLINIPTFYSGIIISKSITSSHKQTEVCSFFIEKLTKLRKKIDIRVHYNSSNIRSFQWYNYFDEEKNKFLIKPFYTNCLNIENFNRNKLDKSLNSNRLREIKKARKNKLESKISNNVNILDQLNKLTYKKERNINEKFLSNQIAEHSLKNNYGSLLITEDDNKEPLAASLFLYDNNNCYYMVGGSNPNKRSTGASSINIYDHIINFINNKKKNVDFVGANSPQRGYFKTSFGGELKIYFEIKI